MVGPGARESERLKKIAQQQAQREEERRQREIEVDLAERGLPIDGSLEFRFVSRDTWTGAFKIKTKEVYQTADGETLYPWSIEAFWNVSQFHPGQILKFTHAFPQSNPEAEYNEVPGAVAPTDFGPVGAKYRFAVVLWTTTEGLFVIPLYTLDDGTNFKAMKEERIKDWVTLTTESTKDPQHTKWAGHSITMNLNPNVVDHLAPCCYGDLSQARPIGRKEFLQEDYGGLDGDEYLRLLSLYKIRSDEWLQRAFDRFETGVTFDHNRIVQPGSVSDRRKEYDDLEEWQQTMADKHFLGQFRSQKARDRYLEKMKKKPGPGGGPGPGKGSGGGKGGGAGVTKPTGTAKKEKKPALGK